MRKLFVTEKTPGTEGSEFERCCIHLIYDRAFKRHVAIAYEM